MVAAILFSGHPYIGRHYRATLIDGEAIIYAMRDSILTWPRCSTIICDHHASSTLTLVLLIPFEAL